jgi:hypothetical protein
VNRALELLAQVLVVVILVVFAVWLIRVLLIAA